MPTSTTKHITVEPTETYAAAYAKLAAIAEKLKGTAPVSIDTLVGDVRAARAAHAVCRARLAAVRAEIDAEIAATETDPDMDAA